MEREWENESGPRLTKHAQKRLSQRGIRQKDLELLMKHGSEVQDGYFMTNRDADRVIRRLKETIRALERLKGKRAVVTENAVVTAFHVSPRTERSLLRHVTVL